MEKYLQNLGFFKIFYCHYLVLNKSIQLQIVKSKEAIPGIYMKVLRTHEMSASLQRRHISQLFEL